MSVDDFQYDLIIIGGGSGGLACAKVANELGARVMVVDYVKPTYKGNKWGLGGTCVNVGCIPKKLMHQAALLGEDLQDAESYGWQVPDKKLITLDWAHMMDEIQNLIKSTNWMVKVQLRTKNIGYLNGMASFVDNHTIKVKLMNNEAIEITGKYTVIAAGNRPTYPDISGAREFGITSDDLFNLTKPPGKTLIVGAGYICMECAGFLRSFGYEVFCMVRGEILGKFDRQMANIIMESLKHKGIKFLIPCIPLSVTKRSDNRLVVNYINMSTKVEELQIFDTVIWAIGRKHLWDDLNLSSIGVAIEQDLIVVNNQECTSVESVYAIGDIAKGRPNLTPVAVAAGQLLAKRLFSNCKQLMNYINVPTTLFTPIEYAFVGMTEEDAISQYTDENIEVYHGYYIPLEYALPDNLADFCYIKSIAMRKGDQEVLGIHFIGPNAGEVIQGFAVALNCRITVAQLLNTIGVNITNAQRITQTFVTKRSGLDPSKEFNCGS